MSFLIDYEFLIELSVVGLRGGFGALWALKQAPVVETTEAELYQRSRIRWNSDESIVRNLANAAMCHHISMISFNPTNRFCIRERPSGC